MTLPLPYPFDRGYLQLALAAGLVVGIAAPLIGAFLVQRRLSLLGDGIGHVAFAGVAVGIATGLQPVWVALAAAVLASVALEVLRVRGRAAGDLALAVLFYAGIAAGVVVNGKAGALNASTLGYLFGSILTATAGDVLTIAILGIVVSLVIAVLWRALLAITIDPEGARVAGLPVDALNVGIAVLAAVVVVAGMRVVGVLLIAALMVLPVGAAQRLAGSFRSTLLLSSAIGAIASVAGLGVARVADLPAGATIVLVVAGVFVVAAVVGRRSLRPAASPAPHTAHSDP